MTHSQPKKVALITGASAGIGAVYADRLAARGYDLILVARRADRLQALSARLAADHGIHAQAVVADLGKAEDLVRLEKILSTTDKLHLLVNNAGIARLGLLAQRSAADTADQIALNITALTRLTQAALPGLLARNAGVIINIASVLGIHALPISAVYSGTKAFVLHYSRGLQQELSATGVKVQVVLPASTSTELWDLSGVPLAALDQSNVMRAEHMVDAALAGLEQGEEVTWPSVADARLWENYEAARSALFAGSQAGSPAPRYRLTAAH